MNANNNSCNAEELEELDTWEDTGLAQAEQATKSLSKSPVSRITGLARNMKRLKFNFRKRGRSQSLPEPLKIPDSIREVRGRVSHNNLLSFKVIYVKC